MGLEGKNKTLMKILFFMIVVFEAIFQVFDERILNEVGIVDIDIPIHTQIEWFGKGITQLQIGWMFKRLCITHGISSHEWQFVIR